MEKRNFLIIIDKLGENSTDKIIIIAAIHLFSEEKGGFMESYEINKDTYAVMSVNEDVAKVIEKNDEYLIDQSSFEVMENSCQYYGSSAEGRIKGTKMILGSNYKVPIVIEESNDIIFFPTEAINSNNCVWISLNNIEKYEKCNGFTKVTFTSGKELYIKMSISSFEMQVLRANRLSSVLKRRRDI